MNKNAAQLLKSLKNEIDDYEMTIGVVKVFGHEMIWDSKKKETTRGSIFWSGRRMTTSATNKISPEKTITPDIVIKINNEIGTVAEVKQGLPKDHNRWEKNFKQLIKYDDNLQGWFADNNDSLNHDVVLLVPDHLSVKVEEYLEEKRKNAELTFERNFAAIAYYRTTRSQEFISLRKFFGNLSNTTKDEELRLVKQVPVNTIFAIYNFFFIDQKPPLPYIMNAVWEQIANYIDIDKVAGNSKDITMKFSLQQIVRDLKSSNFADGSDARNPSLPRSKWIREALDELVEQKFLIKKQKSSYSILFKKYQRLKEPLESFSKKYSLKNAEIEIQKKQLTLFKS